MSNANNEEVAGEKDIEEKYKPVGLADLSETIQESAKNAGWSRLTDVQSKSIPYVLNDNDIMVQSQTGSGKTGAYLLPLIDNLKSEKKLTQVLILVPTRELAVQVDNNAKTLFENTGIKSVCVYGGVSYKTQRAAFDAGVQVIIGTPGRILDHLLKKNLSLKHLKYFILDEADRMLSMGFLPDMQKLKDFLPQKRKANMMFSATYPPQVVRLSKIFLQNPDIISLSQDHVHVLATSHTYYRVPAMDKDRFLVKLIEMENPNSAIIFCNTKAKVNYICEVLKRFGYDAAQMNADLPQKQREKVLQRIKAKQLKFLVATDVAARGIDIPDLTLVVHYEVPEDPEAYIHRSGRTGRAGATGKVISITAGIEAIEIKKIAKKFGINLEESQEPSDSELEEVITQRSVAFMESNMRDLDNIQKERLARFIPVVQELAKDEELVAQLAMLIDQYYHKKMHESVFIAETPEEKPREAKPKRKRSRPKKKPYFKKSNKPK